MFLSRRFFSKPFNFSPPSRSFSELREWFFYLDIKGLLYMEETEPKIYPNAIKDERFLKIFYKNLERNNTGRFPQYGWMSKCWGEFNMIRCEKNVPIIFQHLEHEEKPMLTYGLAFKQEFDPTKLLATPDGVIFHETNHPNCKYGIFSSNLSMQLADNIEFENEEFYFNWEGKKLTVPISHEIETYFETPKKN